MVFGLQRLLLVVVYTMLSRAVVVHTARLHHNAKRSSLTFNCHWKRMCMSVATGSGDDLSWSSDQEGGPASIDTGDLLVTGLNGAQDISVKVVSCREGSAIDR